jgi:hypothetical protein
MAVLTPSWWVQASKRAAATALAGLIPYVTLVLTDATPLGRAASATALLILASYATSLAGLPELGREGVSLVRAAITRTLKTFGQSLTAWIGTAVLFSELDWTVATVAVVGPTLITLLRTLLTALPEVDEPYEEVGAA